MSSSAILHLVLHLFVPLAVARGFFRDRWLKAWLILLSALLIDLDHLLADPIYDSGRCSIGFHPLHSWPAITAYALLTIPARTRLLGVGLLIHIALDGIDCLFM